MGRLVLGDREVQAQQQRYVSIQRFQADVLATHFLPDAPNSARQIGSAAGEQAGAFGRYHQSVRVIESVLKDVRESSLSRADAARVKGACATVEAQADNYLKLSGGLLARLVSGQAARQKAIVAQGRDAARRLALAMDTLSIEEPTPSGPWDSATQARVAELRAAIGFETSRRKARNFRTGPADSVTCWIETQADQSAAPVKAFIFKPARGDRPVLQGDAAGTGPVKEVLVSAMAKRFEQATGIHLGVPETHMVKLASHALNVKGLGADGQPEIGSLQEFVASAGTLKEQPREALASAASEDCERIALCDVMSLNMDRNLENLLSCESRGEGPQRLSLIDHGDALPSRQDFRALAPRCSGVVYNREDDKVVVHSALLRMPAAYLPFSDATVTQLGALDAESLICGMREDCRAMDAAHPGLHAQARMDEERLHMSKRAIQFVQRAAAELSPAGIQIAIGRWGNALFQAADQDFDKEVAAAIADIQPKMAAYQTLLSSEEAWLVKAFTRLFKLGLWAPGQGLDGWVMEDPARALAALPQRNLI